MTNQSPSDSVPTTISALENSKWAEAAKSQATQNMLIKQIPRLIGKYGNSAVAGRAKQALDLFTQAKSKGQDIITARNVIILAAALVYFISPLDCIPDILPVVGWLDDIGVLGLAVSFVMSTLNKQASPESAAAAIAANDLKQAEEAQEHIKLRTDAGLSQAWDMLETMGSDGNTELEPEQLEEWRAAVQDPLRRVVFAGGFSAGKSSLINALLGHRLLKTSPLPCTPVLTTILACPDGHPAAVWAMKDGTTEIWNDMACVADFDDTMADKAQELTITCESDLLDNGLTLVDTCGLESTEHQALAYDALPRAAAFVYVKSAKVGSLTKAESDFFNSILENITGNRLIVVLNKADLVAQEDLEKLKRQMEQLLWSHGIRGVKFYATSAKEGAANTYDLDSLRKELLYRARTSIPELERQMAEEYVKTVQQQKEARLQLQKMNEKEKQQARQQLQIQARERIFKLEETTEDLKEALKKKMQDLIEVELMPCIREKLGNSPVNEDTAKEIRTFCRNELSFFVQEQAALITEKLKEINGREQMREALSATTDIRSTAPETREALVKKGGDLILPAISILGFLSMGPWAWLTTLALPTLVMDRLGVGGKLADIINTFGIGAKARKEFEASIHQELQAAAHKITESFYTMMDNSVRKQEALLLENSNL